jgi:tRNA pseudouridine55 synthase
VSRRRGSRPGDPVGVCIIDKPAGCTSHDVVARLRRELGTRRVGHAGTLDPMATGVLVVGVGAATKLLTFITGVPKTYEARIRFGAETDSLDADGGVTATHDMSGLDPDAVRAGAAALTGDILQVPPMVSALRVDGRRLHELAREGIEVEREARPVTVYRYELRPTDDPLVWDAIVECSSGTYVRTLAADLGHALGGGAHLAALRRTDVGPFAIAEATSLENPVLLPPVEAVRHLAHVRIADEVEDSVRHGRVLEREQLGVEGEGPWAVTDPSEELLAVYEPFRDGRTKPAIVLSTQVAG